MAVKRARASFAAVVDGVPVVITEGQLVDESDPVIRGRESAFEDVGAYMARSRPVEDTTAAPDSKRSRRKPSGPSSSASA